MTWTLTSSAGRLFSFDAAIAGSDYQNLIRAAFDTWEKLADIDFVEVAQVSASNIVIGWAGMDGVGQTLAQASWQSSRGVTNYAEVAFDLLDVWKVGSGGSGANFFTTALHEIGHAIGLGHADEQSSAMYPYLGSQTGLSSSDVSAIQKLYGPAVVQQMAQINQVAGTNASDIISGTGGADLIFAYEGSDTVAGGSGHDQISGGAGNDSLDGGAGNDELFGDGGEDSLTGGSGDDRLVGGDQSDRLAGGSGDDRLFGGNGSDTYIVEDARAVVSENDNEGYDEIFSTISLSLSRSIEAVVLCDTANTVVGNALDNRITGNLADNVLRGAEGSDVLDGRSGNDRLDGGIGLDYLTGGDGQDTFVFSTVRDSGVSTSTSDRIMDFSSGDRIDVSAIDAIAGGANDSFLLDQDGSFSAGEIRQTLLNGQLQIEFNINGDGASDMMIAVARQSFLGASDFML